MQEYKRTDIGKDAVVPLAERMHREGRQLVMIHGFINGEGQLDISYDYAVDPAIESYHVVGETVLPSIGDIYDTAATWPEESSTSSLPWNLRAWTPQSAVPAGGHAGDPGQGPDNGDAAEGTRGEKSGEEMSNELHRTHRTLPSRHWRSPYTQNSTPRGKSSRTRKCS